MYCNVRESTGGRFFLEEPQEFYRHTVRKCLSREKNSFRYILYMVLTGAYSQLGETSASFLRHLVSNDFLSLATWYQVSCPDVVCHALSSRYIKGLNIYIYMRFRVLISNWQLPGLVLRFQKTFLKLWFDTGIKVKSIQKTLNTKRHNGNSSPTQQSRNNNIICHTHAFRLQQY